MTIRVSRLSSCLSLLVSTLFLQACLTTDKTLGDNLIPSNQDLSLQSVTFDLPVDSRLTDSLQTSYLFDIQLDMNHSLIFGACQDPVFGLTEAGAVFQFAPWNSHASRSYGENPEPVSLTLRLNCSTKVLDQSQASIPQNIFLHEITTDLSYKDAYNNSLLPENWDHTPLNLPGQVYFGTDTATVALSLDFARELLSANQQERDSVSAFVKRFKGLYLRTELPDAGVNMGRLNYSPISAVEMVLKYKVAGADSVIHYYPTLTEMSFNSIRHTAASIDPHPSSNIYSQGLAGPKPYIDFVALTKNIRTWAQQNQIDVKNLLISRAEVVLSYDPSTENEFVNQYPSSLFPCTHVRGDSIAYYLPIKDIYYSNSDGSINRSKYLYSFNITNYLQTLLKKDTVTEQDNTWLMQTSYVENQYTGVRTYYVNNTSYPLAIFQGTGTDARPVIKITYSILK